MYGRVEAVSSHLTGAVHRRIDETLLKDPAPDEPVIHNLIVARGRVKSNDNVTGGGSFTQMIMLPGSPLLSCDELGTLLRRWRGDHIG